jgi:hypothetical protein
MIGGDQSVVESALEWDFAALGQIGPVASRHHFDMVFPVAAATKFNMYNDSSVVTRSLYYDIFTDIEGDFEKEEP